ncbi:MAG: DUF2064 domain-containing protein [Candidatus Nanoarchaeia archaeon]
MKKENVVIIFAKWPVLGKCKTRIAAITNEQFSLELSRACLTDLVSRIKESKSYDLIFGVDNKEEANLFKANYNLACVLTSSSKQVFNQSEKFSNLFSNLLTDYKKVVLIPMDVPFLQEQDLTEAFSLLNNKKYVVGPELNGGIYLIGINTPFEKNVFENVRWSTPFSCKDFILNCSVKNIEVLELKTDLNTFEDIINTEELIEKNCPTLSRLIRNSLIFSKLKRKRPVKKNPLIVTQDILQEKVW